MKMGSVATIDFWMTVEVMVDIGCEIVDACLDSQIGEGEQWIVSDWVRCLGQDLDMDTDHLPFWELDAWIEDDGSTFDHALVRHPATSNLEIIIGGRRSPQQSKMR